MINFVVRHSLDDIIPDTHTKYEFIGSTVEDAAFLIERSTDNIEIIKFNLIPPSITPILNGDIEKNIKDVSLSVDKRYIAYTVDNNIKIIDLENPNDKPLMVENCNKFSFVLSNKGIFFVYEREQTLNYSTIVIHQGQSKLYQPRKEHILKNVLWWTTIQKSKILVALNLDKQGNKIIHVYQFQDTFIEILSFQIPKKFDYIIPTHVYLVNQRNILIASVGEVSLTVLSYPSLKATCIPYNTQTNPILSFVDSILVAVIPNHLIAFIDAEGDNLTTQLVEDKTLQVTNIPANIRQNLADTSIFYDVDRNAFLSLEIIWEKFSKVLETKDLLSWHFIGHISSAHTVVSFFAQDIIRSAPTNFFTGLIHFYLEYFVSGIYAWLGPDLPPDLIKYVPHMVPLNSLLMKDHSEQKVREALISSDLIIPYSVLSKSKFWEEILVTETEYCPKGFWHLSTIILLFLFYFNIKGSNTKLPPAIADLQPAMLLPPPVNPEHLKAMKDMKDSQIMKFLTDYFKKSCAIASALPGPNPDSSLIDKLRFEFAIYIASKHFYLPYNVNRLPTLEYLFLVNSPRTFLYSLANEQVLQTFSGIMSDRDDLRARSPIDLENAKYDVPLVKEYDDLLIEKETLKQSVIENEDIFPMFYHTASDENQAKSDYVLYSEKYSLNRLESLYC